MRATTRAFGASVRMMVIATVVLGVGYPAAGLLVAQVMPHQAEGSLVSVDGEVVASALLGQAVSGDQWFHGRPSAGGNDGMASGGSNAGPNNPDLVAEIDARRAEVALREGISPASVPADAVTASASGLDPHISPEYAELQVERVARERGLAPETVRDFVAQATSAAPWIVLGSATVNVTTLNAALAAA